MMSSRYRDVATIILGIQQFKVVIQLKLEKADTLSYFKISFMTEKRI